MSAQRSSAFAPLGAFTICIRSRKIRLPATPQVTRTFDLIRFGGLAAIRTGCVWLVRLPAASVAVVVTVYAPGAPYACATAPPVAIPPSPKLQLSDTGETRSLAAAAIGSATPTFAPGGTLELSEGAAASKLAAWNRQKSVPRGLSARPRRDAVALVVDPDATAR